MVSTRTAPTRGEGLRGGLCNVAGAVLSSAGVPQGGGGAQESATILLGKARIANAKKLCEQYIHVCTRLIVVRSAI